MSEQKKKLLANAETILPTASTLDGESSLARSVSKSESMADTSIETLQFIQEGPSDATSSDTQPPESVQPQTRDAGEGTIRSDAIAGFRIVEELGRGAFGVVFRAIDIKLDRQVAIKLPLLSDRSLAEKYIQEARNAARIDTAGVVPVYQVGTTGEGQPFVVQKLVDGATLAAVLKESGSLSVGLAIEYMFKIATALTVAHEAGLVHRDLKPANILIDKHNEPWVADFGMAVFEEEQKSLRGEIAGTPVYMSPEQLAGRADWLDGRTDIWALGVIMYELLAGKLPFTGEHFRELEEQILNRHPRPLSQRRKDVPPKLDAIFEKCCAKDVSLRYASAHQLAADLGELLLSTSLSYGDAQDGGSTLRTGRLAVSMVRGTTVSGNRKLTWTSDGHNRWLSIGLASVALVSSLIGLAVVFYRPFKVQTPLAPSSALTEGASPSGGSRRNATAVVKPAILVSKNGDGTHKSIAAAVKDADDGEEIMIERGVYEENLVLDKNVRLTGKGARANVSIVGINGPAITINQAGRVALGALTIDAKVTKGGFSTIELVHGQLQISNCRVSTSSYDCIKAHSTTRLVASDCDFESTDHPAIVAQQTQLLELENCRFSFPIPKLGIERHQPLCGVELTECGGTFTSCTFSGIDHLGKGVSCRDADAQLVIDGCTFQGLLHGVELFGCKTVDFNGVNKLSGCDIGIYAEASQGTIRDLQLTSCVYGLCLIEASTFSLSTTTIENNSRVGVQLMDSLLDLEQCTIDKNAIGVVQDNVRLAANDPPAEFIANECNFRDNEIGLLLVSGNVRLVGGLFSLNQKAGIAVVSRDQLSEVMRVDSRAASGEAVRSVSAKRTRINGKTDGPAVLFNATGSYQLEGCPYLDSANNNRPALGADLISRTVGQVTRVIERPSAPQQ